MDRRWAKMRRLTLDALGHSDVLGLSANPLSIMQSAQLRASMSHAPVAGQDKVKAFQGWMDAGLHQVVVGYSGTWLHPYIGAAVEIAKRRAAGLADEKPITTDAAPRANRLDTMCSLATTELQGICEAVSQQACRELAAGLLQGKTPKRIAARVANRVARVGKVRGRMLANTIVVSTHAGATLDEFRARGITHVGTKAERKRRKPTTDAAFITDRNTDGPSAYAIGNAEKGQASLEEQFGEDETVDVLNADDPCPECEEISQDGPYTLDQAESLIPAHPNCECAFVPSDDARFADVRELSDYNPNHEPAGSPEGGRFASAGSEGGGGSAVPDYRPGVLTPHSPSVEDAKHVKAKWIEASPIKTMTDVRKLAAPAQTALANAGRQIAEKLGITFKNPGHKIQTAKGEARVEEKAALRGGKFAAVTDVARATFIVDHPAQADAVIAELGKHFEVATEPWRVTDVNYADRAANARMPNGLIAELQFMDPYMAHAKSEEGGGHKLYKELRESAPNAKVPNPEKFARATAESRVLYGNVLENYPNEWKKAFKII